jgi:hypothetical protein
MNEPVFVGCERTFRQYAFVLQLLGSELPLILFPELLHLPGPPARDCIWPP